MKAIKELEKFVGMNLLNNDNNSDSNSEKEYDYSDRYQKVILYFADCYINNCKNSDILYTITFKNKKTTNEI